MKINLVNENFTSDYVENLLRARGVEDIELFMRPTDDCLQSPLGLKGITMGAILFRRMVHDKRRILVIVDADTDGYCSSALIYQYIKRLEPECPVDWWLHEGKQHGLNDHIERLMESDIHYDLVIVPDAGTNDGEFFDKLGEIGTLCLIMDHHQKDSTIPLSDNAVIINNQISPGYYNKDLVGTGVTWQFCRYIDMLEGTSYADDYADLAALATISDMGSMLSLENRYLYVKGFAANSIKNDFLKALLIKQAYSITGKTSPSWEEVVAAITPTAIAFYIVPLINAMIRVGTMAEKERMFNAFLDGSTMVPSGKRGARDTLERIDIESARECANAKAKQNRIKEQAAANIEIKIFNNDLLANKVLLVELDDEDDFPSELNGLIANYLADKYQRPTIVVRRNNEGELKGSMRGLNDSELKDFRQALFDTGLPTYCSGHANAAGLGVRATDAPALIERLNQILAPINFSEGSYDVNFIRSATSSDLRQLIISLSKASHLWGQNNNEALIYITNIPLTSIRVMGQNKDTLKIEANGISYMKFKATELIDQLSLNENDHINVVGRANLNSWGGNITPQIFIDDYEIIKGE